MVTACDAVSEQTRAHTQSHGRSYHRKTSSASLSLALPWLAAPDTTWRLTRGSKIMWRQGHVTRKCCPQGSLTAYIQRKVRSQGKTGTALVYSVYEIDFWPYRFLLSQMIPLQTNWMARLQPGVTVIDRDRDQMWPWPNEPNRTVGLGAIHAIRTPRLRHRACSAALDNTCKHTQICTIRCKRVDRNTSSALPTFAWPV